jgi:hypothetical protein
MPLVLDTPECMDDVDVHDQPRAHPGFWRTLAQCLVRPHAPRSPRTPRSCAMPHPQKMETPMELVARQYPFLYIQAGSGL